MRVHASLLRKRLAEYFQKEGINEALIVEISRANYAPTFRKRNPLPVLSEGLERPEILVFQPDLGLLKLKNSSRQLRLEQLFNSADEPSMSQLRSQVNAKTNTKENDGFPYFETLLRVKKGASLPRYVTIVMSRSPQTIASHDSQTAYAQPKR